MLGSGRWLADEWPPEWLARAAAAVGARVGCVLKACMNHEHVPQSLRIHGKLHGRIFCLCIVSAHMHLVPCPRCSEATGVLSAAYESDTLQAGTRHAATAGGDVALGGMAEEQHDCWQNVAACMYHGRAWQSMQELLHACRIMANMVLMMKMTTCMHACMHDPDAHRRGAGAAGAKQARGWEGSQLQILFQLLLGRLIRLLVQCGMAIYLSSMCTGCAGASLLHAGSLVDRRSTIVVVAGAAAAAAAAEPSSSRRCTACRHVVHLEASASCMNCSCRRLALT